MHSQGQRKCLHCHEFFEPDARNRYHQRYCPEPACQRASKAASQRRWLSQPANRDHFRGPINSDRVRQWRAAHPGYWKRRGRQSSAALQDLCTAQPAVSQEDRPPDDRLSLQDVLRMQPPLLVGLVAHLADVALQEDIVVVMGRLVAKGQAVLGVRSAGPRNDVLVQTNPLCRTTAPRPTAV